METLFPDLAFLGSRGVLTITVPAQEVQALRVEVPDAELRLEAVSIVGEDGTYLSPRATVESSRGAALDGAVPRADELLDFASPKGAVVEPGHEGPAWLEIRFEDAPRVAAIHVRNIGGKTSCRAGALRVVIKAHGREETVHDGAARREMMRGCLEHANALRTTPLPPVVLEVTELTAAGDYPRALATFRAARLRPREGKAIRSALNSGLLLGRGMEWTGHGPVRTFRFWSADEKARYVRATAEIAHELSALTQNVCLGFGSVLAVTRDGDLIPHDDDLDLVVAFEPHEAATLDAANALVERFLSGRGYTVTGRELLAHRKAARPGSKPVDVFVALREGDALSSFPAARAGIEWDDVFPAGTGEFLGVQVPLPRHPERYLAAVYGENWQTPNPYFGHTWKRSRAEYADLRA